MKLTNEQLLLIDKTLELNGLLFEDIKLEIIDHIASDIESLMEQNQLGFEDNLKTILTKWNKQLKPSFSGLIGFTNPKIITEKIHQTVKRKLISILITSFVLTLLSLLIYRNFSGVIDSNIFQYTFRIIAFAELSFVILAWTLLWRSKHQTTFSYLMKKKTFGLMIFLLMIGLGLFPIKLNHVDPKIAFLTTFCSITYVLLALNYLQLANKHFQFEKKLSISKA